MVSGDRVDVSWLVSSLLRIDLPASRAVSPVVEQSRPPPSRCLQPTRQALMGQMTQSSPRSLGILTYSPRGGKRALVRSVTSGDDKDHLAGQGPFTTPRSPPWAGER